MASSQEGPAGGSAPAGEEYRPGRGVPAHQPTHRRGSRRRNEPTPSSCAGTRTTRAVVNGFATRFGPVGPLALIPEIRAGRHLVRAGETFDLWAKGVRAMRAAVDLAAALASGEARQVREWVSFLGDESDPTGVRFFRAFEDRATTVVNVTREHSAVAAHLRPNGWARAARIVLHEMVNARLRDDTRARLVFDPRRDALGLRIGCDTLRAALWLQFASALDAGRIRRCEACGALLVVAEGISRSDRKTCSDKCRQRLTRERRAQAARKTRRKTKAKVTTKGRARRGTSSTR